MKQQEVVLVTEQDKPIGVMEKMEAHRRGVLHRAFSVFIFDPSGRLLLQQRAGSKYHGAYLWTNTCCSHPAPLEKVEDAASRRLQEELGFTAPLKKIFTFIYNARVENELIEHEFDHVFAGEYDGPIEKNPEEVNDFAYVEVSEIKERLQKTPEQFTTWFRIAFPKMEAWWKTEYRK